MEGKLSGIDGKQEYVQVANLATKMFTYPHATLRSLDILAIHVQSPIQIGLDENDRQAS